MVAAPTQLTSPVLVPPPPLPAAPLAIARDIPDDRVAAREYCYKACVSLYGFSPV